MSPRKIPLGNMKSILEEKNKEEDEEDGISLISSSNNEKDSERGKNR